MSNGVILYMVKELLGHADIKTTERYAHLATGALREAAGAMCAVPPLKHLAYVKKFLTYPLMRC